MKTKTKTTKKSSKTDFIPAVATGIYRIPKKSWFNKKQVNGDPKWKDIYGKKKCFVCKEHFQEGEAYKATNNHKYHHVDCVVKS